MTTIIQDNEPEGPSEDWVEGYIAGCSEQQDRETRLECVRQAANGMGAGEDLLAVARAVYKFVTGQTCDECGAPLDHGEDDETGTVQ